MGMLSLGEICTRSCSWTVNDRNLARRSGIPVSYVVTGRIRLVRTARNRRLTFREVWRCGVRDRAERKRSERRVLLWSLTVAAAALAIGATACTESSAPPEMVAVRDSAGVRIVESLSGSRYAAPWVLGNEPGWTVGEQDGDSDYLLDRVVGAMRLPDGNILIANGGSNQLRFYDSSGRFVRAEGREGEGPGEFEYMRALGACRAGGFVAFDLNWQSNAYTVAGEFIEKTVFRAPEGVTPYNLSCDAHGHVVLLGWGRAAIEGPQIGFYQAYDRLLLVDKDGGVQGDYGQRLVSERIGTSGGSRPHPAGRATVFSLHADQLYVGSGERFEVEVRDLDNSLRSLLRGPTGDLRVTDAVRSDYLNASLRAAAEDRHPAIRSQVEGWEWPENLPAFVEMVVDSEGVLWLRAFSLDADAPKVWSLMDPETGYIGDIELPERHSLLAVGADYLLMLATDDLGVQRVVMTDLDRRTTQ